MNQQGSLFDTLPPPKKQRPPVADDICARKHRGNPQSVEANRGTQSRKEIDRQRIVAFVKSRGERGATCAEIHEATGIPYTTCSGRLSELKSKEFKCVLIESGEKRPTPRGAKAAVVVINQKA